MSPPDGWDRDSLWDLWGAALTEPPCNNPECECQPPDERPHVRTSNDTTAAIVIAALMLIIAIGVILS